MTNKKYPIIAFISIYFLHAAYSIYGYWRVAQLWAVIKLDRTFVLSYIYSNDYLLGFSYALAGAFTVLAVLNYSNGRKRGALGVASGAAITGFLYFGSCFLIGCCGSPMLVVYLSLFGSRFLGFTKPLIALLTIISVGLSYYWMKKGALIVFRVLLVVNVASQEVKLCNRVLI